MMIKENKIDIINSKHMMLGECKEEFLAGVPFPHLVLDDFLENDFFTGLKNDFKNMASAADGKSFDTVVEEKKWISLNASLPGSIKSIVDVLNSDAWVENMRSLTGIDSLISTQHGNTKLANYHVMEPGGILGSHVDHSFEPELGIPHVLNILIYLSEDWAIDAGGGTLLYNKTGKKVIKKVEYKPNRAVLFLHTPYSFHGVERINSDSKNNRRTIYVDYYSTSYEPYNEMPLAFDKKWFKHGTMFKLANVFDYFKKNNMHYTKSLAQYHVNRYLRKLKGL